MQIYLKTANEIMEYHNPDENPHDPEDPILEFYPEE